MHTNKRLFDLPSTMLRSLNISVIPQTYEDDISVGSDQNQRYRHVKCSQRYLFTAPSSQWHVKLTFDGTFLSPDTNFNWLRRKKRLREALPCC
ncbi:hypothetical protein F4802DRAFT_72219 [Xylaria palmicola]|nr:hypothetical protein F4802DRAFT_72219 [Xylaria palmicola]